MADKKFIYQKTVYLGDTNLLGNVYFARYFAWLGEAREEFLKKCVPRSIELFEQGLRLLTVRASIDYKKELILFDEITISIQIKSIRKASLELIFTLNRIDEDLPTAIGYQRIAFADSLGKIQPMPNLIKEAAEEFLIEEGDFKCGIKRSSS